MTVVIHTLYFQTLFVLSLGPFVFFNVQKTKYLQLLTSVMRWLAFTIMIVYAVNKLIQHGIRGNPPVANITGKPENCDGVSLTHDNLSVRVSTLTGIYDY